MESNTNSSSAIDPRSKKIRKTKTSEPSKPNKKRLDLHSSLKKCILLELKKGLIEKTQADFKLEELDEDKCFELLEKVKLNDYNRLLKEILSKHVRKGFHFL